MGRLHRNEKPPVVFLILIGMLLVGCTSSTMNQSEPHKTRQSVELITLSAVHIDRKSDVTQVAITGSKPFAYNISSYERPPHIIVNIPGAHFVDVPTTRTIAQAGIKTVEISHVQERDVTARLLIRLEKPITYSVQTERKRLLVNIPHAAASPSPTPLGTKSASLSGSVSAEQDYRVGPQDVLAITVFDEADLSKNYRVTGEGSISFPLIGKVLVNGRTTSEIEEVLSQRLAQGYLIDPQVSLVVAEHHSQQVLVLGAVRNPGQFPLRGTTTLLEMISRAGGLDHRDGKSNALVLIRESATPAATAAVQAKDVTTTRIDLEKFLKQGDMTLNVPVQGRDVIYVPRPASVFVIGEVKQPGPISLTEDLTLVGAIGKAGGFTRIASPSRSRVIRVVNGVERTLRVNVADIIKRGDRHKDIALEPGDIVVVPESFF